LFSCVDEGNDKNNNRVAAPLVDPFSDGLQTIHEDAVLVIEDDSWNNDVQEMTSPKKEVTFQGDVTSAANNTETTSMTKVMEPRYVMYYNTP